LRPVPDNPPPSITALKEIAPWLVGHTIATVERELILQTLRHCAGNRTWAAGILGISVPALEAKLRSYAGPRIVSPHRGDNENEQDDQPGNPPDHPRSLPRPASPRAQIHREVPREVRRETRREIRREPSGGGVGLHWVIGSVLTVIAVIAMAFRFFGDNATVASHVRGEPPRIELSIKERRILPLPPSVLALPTAPSIAPAVAFATVDIEQEPVMDSVPAAIDTEQDTVMDFAPAASDVAALTAAEPDEMLAEAAAVGFEEQVATITTLESQLPEPEELDFDVTAAILATVRDGTSEELAPLPIARPASIPLTDKPKRVARPAPRRAAVAAQPPAPLAGPNPLHILFPFAILLQAATGQVGGTAKGAAPALCCNR